jgi:hypothetical protein
MFRHTSALPAAAVAIVVAAAIGAGGSSSPSSSSASSSSGHLTDAGRGQLRRPHALTRVPGFAVPTSFGKFKDEFNSNVPARVLQSAAADC